MDPLTSPVGVPVPRGEVVVFGSANVDTAYVVDRLPAPGETVLGRVEHRGPGGKGSNQAVAARVHGSAKTTFIGAVGDDADGRAVAQALRSRGVRAELTITTSATGSATILVDATGENSIVVAAGANDEIDAGGAATALGRAAIVLVQLEVPVEATTAAMAAAGGWTVLNASPMARGLPAIRPDLLVVNEGEAREVAGRAADAPLGQVVAALRGIADECVITLGGAGSIYAFGGGILRASAPRVPVVDTTGAGDAFGGALVGALAGGLSRAEALRTAAAAGGWTVQHRGAQAPAMSPAELSELRAQVRVDVLDASASRG
ncbi:ribokinase [Pseudolysinimonas sp.]|uniref:ribokinase n=1 Tax=Pseudolysinimonas sp. TaxID=2680009 RepID=UPI003F7E0572